MGGTPTASWGQVRGGGGGGAAPEMAAVPLCPSLPGVPVAEPAPTPVTSPVPGTVATPELLLVQVTARPLSTLPAASFAVAAGGAGWPTVPLAHAGLTVAVGTGTFATEMDAVPLWPSLAAVTVAEPAATPVTSPDPLTVTTPELLLVQVTARPLSTLPAASFAVADSCAVCPTVTLADAGLTVTVATGTFETERDAWPLWPSLMAVMVAVPAVTPITSPVPLTVATPELLLAQVTVRPVSTFPAESRVVAESCAVCPTVTPEVTGLTLTDATGTGFTTTVVVSDRPPGLPLPITLYWPGCVPDL